MKAAYLLIGGNLGNRLAFLDAAVEKMKQKGIQVCRKSSVFETAAWGITDQPQFLNQVIEVSTNLAPEQLLKEILAIEIDLGRIRTEKNGARTIDIDILYFGDEVINQPGLNIPHERIAIRKFVLIPLAELIPDFIDPSTGKTTQKMLEECQDTLTVSPYIQIEK
jgi:2-amino-4-hydroxy-6-hydroxymethyldihydropteridine diphosphokinase